MGLITGLIGKVVGGVGKAVAGIFTGGNKDDQQVASANQQQGTIWDINGDGEVTPEEKQEVARLMAQQQSGGAAGGQMFAST